MAGSHVFSDWVAPQCMRLMLNQFAIADGMSFEYEKEFRRPFAVGDIVRIKEPWRSVVRDGLGWAPDSIVRRHRDVAMDQIFTSQFIYDSLEKALQMERSQEDINKNIIQPYMKQMSQEIDSRAALFIKNNTPNTVGGLHATPNLDTIHGATTRIWELGGFGERGRSMVVTPQIMETAVTGTVRALFHPPDQISRAFREGRIGRYSFFDWTVSMSLQNHTFGTAVSALAVNGAGQSGTTLNVTGTNGEVFNEGDHISIANVNAANFMTRRSVNRLRHFAITQTTTVAGGVAALPIFPGIIGPGSPYQNVDALPANGAVVTFAPGTTTPSGRIGPFGLAYTKDAFAIVGGELPMPKAGTKEMAKAYTDPDTGINLSFIVDFATRERQFENRLDVLMGFGRLWSEFGAVRIGSAQ